MYVTLNKLDIDVPTKEFAESCKTAAEFSAIICELSERICKMDETGRRLFLNSIIPEMSTNGRDFIKDLYGALLHYDVVEAVEIVSNHSGDYKNP